MPTGAALQSGFSGVNTVEMAKDWHEGLSEKRRRFCEAYSANGGNALDAARKAGYAKPVPEGTRLLENAKIREALEMLRKSTTDAAILTREARQKLWSKIALDESEKIEARLRASELLGRRTCLTEPCERLG